MGKNARQIAMEILVRMQRDAAYSNLTLDAALRRNELPARDAALVSALVYGVEERLYTIDYQLSLYLKQPLKKLKLRCWPPCGSACVSSFLWSGFLPPRRFARVFPLSSKTAAPLRRGWSMLCFER